MPPPPDRPAQPENLTAAPFPLNSGKPVNLLDGFGPGLWAAMIVALALLAFDPAERAAAQPATFAGNAQHTALYSAPAQRLNLVKWSTSIDLANSGAGAHYGAPLITPENTVLVPVKTASGFQISAFEGATGRFKYTLTNDFIPPPIATNGWISVFQPVLATPPSGARLYYGGAGGTVYYIDHPDSDIPPVPVQQCFYTNLADYAANSAAYNSHIFINTPLTAGSNGVVFFGFRLQGTAPAPLSTTDGGFARLDPEGNAAYVLAGTAAADSRISRDSHNCAPALSNDGATLYVAVKGSTAYYAYLLGLDSETLATRYSAFLVDPRNGSPAGVLDDGTASPTIAPDGDVFFGVFGNPDNGSRGFLLHFSPDLQTHKPPSGFGWDYTAAIVPTNMLPSYTGSSSYLLFSKYNNYAGNTDGDGINRIALLDPNATQVDPHPTAEGLVEMREMMTVIGCTPDSEYQGTIYPYAVREWCINTAGVDPATKSIFAPSEDGRIYRWNLASNSITETLTLGSGIGEPYVPTVIAPDGTVYTLNGGTLFALGSLTNVALGIFSSAPDLLSVSTGQPIVFTAFATNLDASGPAPTGTITFQDVTYQGLAPVTNVLASAVPLTNGLAAVTNSTLAANGLHLGSHFITAIYSGDGTFPGGRATLVQKVHAHATTTTLTSAPGSGSWASFGATVASSPAGGGTPTGMLSFWDGPNFLAQVNLNTNGFASCTISNLSANSHAVSAIYSSDTMFASSSGMVTATRPFLTGLAMLTNSAFQFSFSNVVGASFTVLRSTDLSLPLSNWEVLGSPTEILPGQFQFTDPQVKANQQRFYGVRSP
jgi:hypothetical protein